MADTPIIPIACALCDWTSPSLTGNAPAVRRDVQTAVVAHHIDAHGAPRVYGNEVLTYDPDRFYAITVERDLPGFIVASGSTVRVMHDDGNVQAMGGPMSAVERAVLIARLRAWAEALSGLPA